MQHFFLKYIKITAAFAVLLLLLLPLLLQHFFPEVYKNYVCLRSYVVVVVVVAVAVVSHFFPEVHEDYVCLRSYVVVVVVVVVVVADVVCAAAAAAAAAIQGVLESEVHLRPWGSFPGEFAVLAREIHCQQNIDDRFVHCFACGETKMGHPD
jgi:hypothetical protein